MELNRKDKLQTALYDLRYQHPSGITTHSACSRGCGHGARGGGVCPDCLLHDLRDLGVASLDIAKLTIAHGNLQRARLALEEVEEGILNA